jgi:methionine biosynthesis protein MetW
LGQAPPGAREPEQQPSNAVARFYEHMYAEGRQGRTPRGVIGRLFLALRRFELHRVPAVFSLLEPGHRLLDVGCGDGMLLAMAKSSKFVEVYGVDIATPVVNRAQATCTRMLGGLKGVDIRHADLNEPLPFADGFFDALTAVAVVEHIFDPYFSVSEFHRVLAPRGQLIIEVPNLVWLPRRTDVFLGRLPVTGDEDGWDGGHLHYFTFRAVRDLLTSAGFDIEHMGSTGIFPRVRNVWPSLLGGNIVAKATKRGDTSTH